MKIKFVKSFRFEIILYSLLSLIYTILTEAGLFFGICVMRSLFRSEDGQGQPTAPNVTWLPDGSTLNSLDYGRGQGGIPDINGSQGNLPYFRKEGMVILVIFMLAAGIACFILYFLLLTKKFVIYLDEIAQEIQELSLGNFEARVDIRNEDEFAWIAEQLNHMAVDIQLLMDNERKNEKARNDLITSVAHDLRTPLTSIIGYLDLAINRVRIDETTQKKYISIAYDKSKRLEKLIEDLFSYTKYSSGEVIPNVTEIDMVKFMEQMIEEFYPSFEDAGLEYEFTTSDTRAVVVADGDLLARAITNLIGNAVKYGRDGKSIHMKLEKRRTDLSITIINYGEIIPWEDLENIFDRFFRVENSRSSETGGTGLGLAIAKRIILMHYGTINVRSDFEGTVFEIILPLMEESGARPDHDEKKD